MCVTAKTIHHDPARRGRRVDASDRAVGEPVWPLRLSQDHGGVAASGLECGTGPSAADLAAGRLLKSDIKYRFSIDMASLRSE
jgi:hypothetical protein